VRGWAVSSGGFVAGLHALLDVCVVGRLACFGVCSIERGSMVS
jgi:hypothetical protein